MILHIAFPKRPLDFLVSFFATHFVSRHFAADMVCPLHLDCTNPASFSLIFTQDQIRDDLLELGTIFVFKDTWFDLMT